MPQQQTTFSRFLTWWQSGLLAPFSRFSNSETVVRVSNGQIYNGKAESLSIVDGDTHKSSQAVYLNVAAELLMLKQISEAQRSMIVESVIRDIFPFDPEEVIAVWNADKTQMFAILKTDVAADIELLESKGLYVNGIAFDDDSNPESSGFLFADINANKLDRVPSISKVWPVSILLLAASLCVLFMFLSRGEVSRQLSLARDISAHQNQALKKANEWSPEIVSLLKNQRNADDVSSLLKALTSHLTQSTVIEQLIVSDDELLIDASAMSATQLQTNLENSGAFSTVEFVSSISSNKTNDSERFRIKASLLKVQNDELKPDVDKGASQ